MPITTFVHTIVPHGTIQRSYTLKNYNKIKPDFHKNYEFLQTNEFFIVLPELHKYTHLNRIEIGLQKNDYLENIDVLNTNNFILTNITSLSLKINVSISFEQLNKICKIFPNIKKLKIDMFNKSFLTDFNNRLHIHFPFELFDKLENVDINAKSLTITGTESICKLTQMQTLKTLYFVSETQLPIEITTKLTNSLNEKMKSEYDASHKRHEIKFKANIY